MTPDLLSYSGSDTKLLRWEYEHQQLSLQICALLVTLFAFQLSALVFDFLLGMKPRNVSSPSNLYMLLMARSLSVLATLSNLFRLDYLSRLYYGQDIPTGVKISRDPENIKPLTALKFLALISLFPLCNIAAIILCLRDDTILTFSDVKFRNIALGFEEDPSQLLFVGEPRSFLKLRGRMKAGDTPLVQFRYSSTMESTPDDENISVSLNVSVVHRHTLRIMASHNGITVSIFKVLTMFTYTDNKNYGILPSISDSDLDYAFSAGAAVIRKKCKPTGRSSADNNTILSTTTAQNSVRKHTYLPCNLNGSTEFLLKEAVLAVDRHFGIVSSSNMEMSKYNHDDINIEGPVISGKDMKFVKRSRRKIGLFALFVGCGTVIVLRLVCSFFVRNDTDVGLEKIIKNRLGLRCCDSMLQENTEFVEYRLKLQSGVACNYGLARTDMRPVQQFDRGCVGTSFEDLCAEPG